MHLPGTIFFTRDKSPKHRFQAFCARQLDGQVLDLPVPGDYHAETAEWIGV
jgi:hypothetical protein